MPADMTLYIDPETRDIAFDSGGNFATIAGDEATAQCVRDVLLTHLDEFELADGHGTDYDRIQGKKTSQLTNDEIEEVIRDAVFQEEGVREVTRIETTLAGRELTVAFEGVLLNGNTIAVEVTA